ncbi:MAG: hypothetical protein ABI249_08035 [Ornithinibacter sp.]
MAIISCIKCNSDNDIHLEGTASDGSKVLRCGDCGHTWNPSKVVRAPGSSRTPLEMAEGRFATATMVASDRRTRVARRKATFLKEGVEPDPEVTEHFARYQEVFSPAGLAACAPQDLRDFATSRVGGDTGSTAVFTRAWKQLGEEEAAERTRASIDHLLHGPSSIPMEDRLTGLIDDEDGTGMPGFKEAQLTKVLCVVEPARFLPILTYAAAGGKRDVVLDVFGLHLPKVADQTSMTSGRLAVWSNDLLLELAGEGFVDTQHAAAFLTAPSRGGARNR